VALNAEGKIYLQDTEMQLSDLAAKLSSIAGGKMDRRIFVRADNALNYGKVVDVMTTITQAGFTKVALLTSAPSGAGVRTPGAPSGQSTAPRPRSRG
jgi:biopolymer transport protein TolR